MPARYALTRARRLGARRLLWRVRRKLILSYVFVGLVPGLLIVTFFLLAGLMLLFNVSSYLVQSRVRSLTDQARFLAQTALLEVQRSTTAAGVARDAGAPAGERRDPLSVPVDRGRAGARPELQGEPIARRRVPRARLPVAAAG